METAVAASRPAAQVGSLGARTIRALFFLFAAVPVGVVALAVLVAGWSVVAVLAITPLVVPALLGFPGCGRWGRALRRGPRERVARNGDSTRRDLAWADRLLATRRERPR